MSDLAFAARHSMDSPEWYTPSPFVEAAREVLGRIELDPMSHEEANRIVKAERFFTAEDNCFTKRWYGLTFINPSGGLVKRAWHYLMEAHGNGSIPAFVWIGYSLEQLQTLQKGKFTPMEFPLCVPKKRIAFIENQAKRAARIEKIIREGEAPGAKERKVAAAKACREGKPPKDAPSHANYICYGGPYPERFAAEFKQFGRVRL